MSVRRSSVRFVTLLGSLLLMLLLPGTALAQGQGNGGGNGNKGGGDDDPIFETLDVQDTIPPDVVIEPSGGAYADSLLDVTIYWCDDKNLEASTRTIKHNRFTVTSSFSWEYVGAVAEQCNVFGVAYKSEGTIDLSVSGSLSASIKDDAFGNPASDQASYTYSPPQPPTLTLEKHNGD